MTAPTLSTLLRDRDRWSGRASATPGHQLFSPPRSYAYLILNKIDIFYYTTEILAEKLTGSQKLRGLILNKLPAQFGLGVTVRCMRRLVYVRARARLCPDVSGRAQQHNFASKFDSCENLTFCQNCAILFLIKENTPCFHGVSLRSKLRIRQGCKPSAYPSRP